MSDLAFRIAAFISGTLLCTVFLALPYLAG